MSNSFEYTMHTDGGSRGNPGPAASGFVIEGADIHPIHAGQYLGVATNNVAEYSAAIFGLRRLKADIGVERAHMAHVRILSDSELLVKQMNGQYKVKDAELKKLFVDLSNARQDFLNVTFSHIRREQNQEADRMVNETLDRELAPKRSV